jgi:phage gpG-like protein
MNVKIFADELKKKSAEVENLMKRTLPVIVGRMAKDHYQDNFRKSGFKNHGLQRWSATKRQNSDITGAEGQYGPLLSRRNHLFASIKYVPSDFRVVVSNDLPYAPIHNWGGEVNTTVTPKMRRFAWAMYYKNNPKTDGKKKPKKGKSAPQIETTSAQFWKKMALTKKKKLKVNIPQRQFIGESHELNEQINKRIENELTKIIE